MDLDLQIEHFWGDSDSDVSDVSSRGYETDVDSSDSQEVPSHARDQEKDENEFWQQLCEDLFAIAEDQEECNRPEE